jgi:hypothetical protein
VDDHTRETAAPRAGWYPVEGTACQRYWNGRRWSDHWFDPATSRTWNAAAPQRAGNPHRRHFWVAVGLTLACFIAVVLVWGVVDTLRNHGPSHRAGEEKGREMVDFYRAVGAMPPQSVRHQSCISLAVLAAASDVTYYSFGPIDGDDLDQDKFIEGCDKAYGDTSAY